MQGVPKRTSCIALSTNEADKDPQLFISDQNKPSDSLFFCIFAPNNSTNDDLSIQNIPMAHRRTYFIGNHHTHCIDHDSWRSCGTPFRVGILASALLVKMRMHFMGHTYESSRQGEHRQGSVIRICSQSSGGIRYMGHIRLPKPQLQMAYEKGA